jgi:uncharacterized membrane protein
MAQTATPKGASGGSTKRKPAPKKRAPAKSKQKSNAKSNGAGSKKTGEKTVKSAAGGAAAKATLTTRPGGPVRMKMAGAALKAAARKAGAKAKQTLPVLADGSRGVLDKVRDAGWDRMAEKVRTLPVQRSLDVAVPLEAAWDEWMRFDWLPDGAHGVQDIERDDDRLFGRLSGPRVSGDWEAEIVDERVDESLAWQTVEGSDTSGLVTFHRLSDRLTRLELQLDVVPEGMGEALSLVLRRADRRAENVMRGFKAQVEALDPDEYPDVAETADDEDETDEVKETDEVEA